MPVARVLVGRVGGRVGVPVNALCDNGSSHTIVAEEIAHRMKATIFPSEVGVSGVAGSQKARGYCLMTISSLVTDFVITVKALVLSNMCVSYQSHDVQVGSLFEVEEDKLAHDGGAAECLLLVGQDILWHILSFQMKRPREVAAPVVLHWSQFGWLLEGALHHHPSGHPYCVKGSCVQQEYGNSAAVCTGKQQTDQHLLNVETLALIKKLQEYMTLESIGISSTQENEMKPLDRYAIEFFNSHVRFLPDRGCYEVALIFNPDHKPFIPNEYQAKLRFLSLEKKFARYPEFRDQYKAYMEKYFDNGDVELVRAELHGAPRYYLPHSAVFNPQSPTTKCRVVFDASAKTPSGTSLNDCLLKGPNMIQDMLALLVRFRYHRIVLAADVTRMYLCVSLREQDRNYLCFFWRSSESDPLQVYRLTKTGFGVADSAFSSDRVVALHAERAKDRYPMAHAAVIHDRYVDDVTTGADSVRNTLKLKAELVHMMAEGGFKFRKWMSNSKAVMDTIPPEERADIDKPIDFASKEDQGETLKALGQQWNPKSDEFRFETSLEDSAAVATRRNISSAVARLYDPLGLAQPFVVTAKILHQRAWSGVAMPNNLTRVQRRKIWDEPLDTDISEDWTAWYSQLPELNQFSQPRQIRPVEEVVEETLHVFGDASPKAYAAVVYLLSKTTKGDRLSRFIMAKSRVAPKKGETLARLELTASLIGCRLLKAVREALAKPDLKAVLWSDSAITVQWLRAPPERWKEFVANRVKEVHELSTNVEYAFVPGKENPADLATRGISAQELIESKVWGEGPAWLTEGSQCWPEEPFLTSDEQKDALREARPSFKSLGKSHESEEEFFRRGRQHKTDPEQAVVLPALSKWLATDITCDTVVAAAVAKDSGETHGAQKDPLRYLEKKYSNWPMLMRVTAYILRLSRPRLALEQQGMDSQNSERSRGDSKELESTEVHRASLFWIGRMQKECFTDALAALKGNRPLDKKNRLRDLLPYLDEEGLLRVRGRLEHSGMSEETKHPLIIPRKHCLTKLLVLQVHESAHHAGPDWTLYHLRQKYWILMGRRTVVAALKSCLVCRRWRAVTARQAMPPLPASRLQEAAPFARVGLDFAGPSLVTHNPNVETDEDVKVWIVLFVCMLTRAVHVEVVSDMTTEAFIRAFRRFAARRGVPELVWSDNAPTIEKADKEFKFLWEAKSLKNIFRFFSSMGITWKYDSPDGPWQGGHFERLVKSIKDPMKKVLGKKTVSFDEYLTLLIEIEGIVNDRPMSVVKDDVDDPVPVTPSMLVAGHRLRHFPDAVAKRNKPEPKKSTPEMRWRKRLALRAQFAEAFRKDYMMGLQQTRKWHDPADSIKVGEIVLIDNHEKNKAHWPMARVIEVIKGRDGLVRNVVLKTANGHLRRPIQRLVPLEVASDEPVALEDVGQPEGPDSQVQIGMDGAAVEELSEEGSVE